MFSRDLGIDLGTIFTRISEGDEVILEEPTVVAVQLEEQKIVEIGQEALNMLGRVSEEIQVSRPLREGVVAYFEYTHLFLREMIKRVTPMRMFKPQVMITHPHGITSVERRAVHEAVLEALGARANALLVPQPLAAALGIDLPIGMPSGNMIVSMGGGCTQAAVIAVHDIVSGQTLREGGLTLDDAIVTYVRRKYGLIIGQPTAENIKKSIGAAVPQDEEKRMELQGQDQVSGLPKPFTLTTSEVVDALQEPLDRVFETVRQVLEKTPPELASDVIDRGIALCGGGSLLPGLDKLMTQKLGIPTYRVDDPNNAVAIGALRALAIYPVLQRTLPKF
ncbi:MAG TPA: rod shape-determining protein [Anaerolineales bacterium]|nr:rod shape-determining protein [Anaerolineales bacterium]